MNTISCAAKYPPLSISEVVFNDPNTEHFMRCYESGELRCPHLMLWGTNGNGKTTTADLLAKALSKNSGLLLSHSLDAFMKMSDIDGYLHRTVFLFGGGNDRAVIIFNEPEQFSRNLSPLWTIMDRNEDKLVVIITTNEPGKFQNAVKSRCDKYEFTRITPAQYAPRAKAILEQEGLNFTVSEVSQYLQKYSGENSDVRDYLRIMDKLLSLDRAGLLPSLSPAAATPSLRVVV